MDVEGMEIQILYELEYYIDKFKPKLFIEISSFEKTIEFLQKKDYNIYQFITSYLSYEKIDNNFKTDSNFFAIHKSKDTENYNLKPILSKDDINYTYFVEDTIKL